LVRWAGITTAAAKTAIAAAGAALDMQEWNAVPHWVAHTAARPTAAASGTFLLPGFDEFLLGYKDRSTVLASEHAHKIVPGGNGIFKATIVQDARVIGTWKASATKHEVQVVASGFEPLTTAQHRQFGAAAERYASFLGKALTTSSVH
jgi:hypothetical protein